MTEEEEDDLFRSKRAPSYDQVLLEEEEKICDAEAIRIQENLKRNMNAIASKSRKRKKLSLFGTSKRLAGKFSSKENTTDLENKTNSSQILSAEGNSVIILSDSDRDSDTENIDELIDTSVSSINVSLPHRSIASKSKLAVKYRDSLRKNDLTTYALQSVSSNMNSASFSKCVNSPPADKSSHICLFVKASEGSEQVGFSIEKNSKLQKLRDSYAIKKQVDKERVILKYYGLEIQLNDTPEDMALAKDAILEAEILPDDGKYLILKVRHGNEERGFRIKMDDEFSKLYEGVSKKFNLCTAEFKLLFDGISLDPNSTPQQEDMEDDDLIDIKV